MSFQLELPAASPVCIVVPASRMLGRAMRERPVSLAQLRPAQLERALLPYRLPRPERFLLMLVEVAHLWPGCTGLDCDFIGDPPRVVLHGCALEPEQLHALLQALLEEETPGSARLLKAGRRLAAAMLGAVEALSKPVELRCHGQRTARIELSPTCELSLGSLSAWTNDRHLEFRLPPLSGQEYHDQIEILRLGARFGEQRLRINGTVLTQGPKSVEVLEAVPVYDEGRDPVGYLGWSIRGAKREHGVLVLTANGVAVETLELPELPKMSYAAVDARSLTRAPNQSSFVRDHAFERLRRAVLASLASLPQPAPRMAETEQSSRAVALVTGMSGLSFAGLLVPAGISAGAVVLAAPVALMLGLGFMHSNRTEKMRREGELRIAVVEGVGSTLIPRLRERVIRLRLRVPNADGSTRVTHMLTTGPMQAGMRVFVRVHEALDGFVLAALPSIRLAEDG